MSEMAHLFLGDHLVRDPPSHQIISASLGKKSVSHSVKNHSRSLSKKSMSHLVKNYSDLSDHWGSIFRAKPEFAIGKLTT